MGGGVASSIVTATDPLASQLHQLLSERGQTVAVAESLTGGMLAEMLTVAPGASAVFRGGVVTYASEVKHDLLGVDAERVISAECASQMASGVRRLMGSDWALATTGVAGPDRQEDQPVGTVFIGLAGPADLADGTGPAGSPRVEAHRLSLSGSREQIRTTTCTRALAVLLDALPAPTS